MAETQKTRYPLFLSGITVPLIWGGHELNSRYGKGDRETNIGESWELTVRPGRDSVIMNGAFAGRTLSQYIAEVGCDVVSADYDGGRFPLLVKLIDAADRLSVQVHPDDAYAARVEHDSGKTEMWYVIDARPGARLVYGLEPGMGARKLGAALEGGNPSGVLHQVEVHAGDVFFIPAGMVHSIGAGILIAEIQQNSDLTYRVYDYGRLGLDGKPRELHIAQALDVVRPFTAGEIDALRFCAEKSPDYRPVPAACRDGELLAHCDFFRVYRRRVTSPRHLSADASGFHCLLCVGGEALLDMSSDVHQINAGQCVFIPASSGLFTLRGDATVLEIIPG